MDGWSEVGNSPRRRFNPLDQFKKGTPEYIAEKRRMIDLSEDAPWDRTRTADGRPGYRLDFQDEHLHRRMKVHDSDEITPPTSPTSAHAGSPARSEADFPSGSLGSASGSVESAASASPTHKLTLGKDIALGVGGLVAGTGIGMLISGGGESEAGNAGTTNVP